MLRFSFGKPSSKRTTHHLVSTWLRLSFFHFFQKLNASLCFLSPKKHSLFGDPDSPASATGGGRVPCPRKRQDGKAIAYHN
jgi:hypothetical protein